MIKSYTIYVQCNVRTYTHYTVSLYKLEDKQKPHTKLSINPINTHIVAPKTAFTKILAAYGFLNWV